MNVKKYRYGGTENMLQRVLPKTMKKIYVAPKNAKDGNSMRHKDGIRLRKLNIQ